MKQIFKGVWNVVSHKTDKLEDLAGRALECYISQEIIPAAGIRETIFTVAGKAMYRTPSIKAVFFEKHTYSQCSGLGARPLEVEINTVAMFSPVHMWLGYFQIRPLKTLIIVHLSIIWPEHQRSRTLCSQLREGCPDAKEYHNFVINSPLVRRCRVIFPVMTMHSTFLECIGGDWEIVP